MHEFVVPNFMRPNYYIYFILIFYLICSCDKHNNDNVTLTVELAIENDVPYRYNDFFITYKIEGVQNKTYGLKCILFDDAGIEQYSTILFDTISINGLIQEKVNLRKVIWLDGNDTVSFYNIESKLFYIQLRLIDIPFDIVDYKSNELAVELNKENPDTSLVDNFVIYDIYGIKYELLEQLEQKDFIFFFEFAVWCGWSKRSIPLVRQIDSTFNEKVSVIGVEGSTKDYLANFNIDSFIQSYEIAYPVFLREDNSVLNGILHPDNQLSFPRFLLINKKRKIVYRQAGHSENLMDSVMNYLK